MKLSTKIKLAKWIVSEKHGKHDQRTHGRKRGSVLPLSKLGIGQTKYMEVKPGTGWGLDVKRNGRNSFSYRRKLPQFTGDWESGSSRDVRSEFNELKDDFDFMVNN